MSFRLWKDKYPQREGKGYLVNVEWNQGKDKPISLWTMTEEHLEELRRVLDVGMGDCDHCDAWTLYSSGKLETTSEQVDRTFAQHQVWLKGHTVCISNHAGRISGLETRIKGVEDDLIGHAGEHMKNNLVEKVKNLETKTDNILKYNGVDWKATNSRIWEHHGKIMDITKVLNDVADELHKVKDFVGMKK